jgi:O-antigen ligase
MAVADPPRVATGMPLTAASALGFLPAVGVLVTWIALMPGAGGFAASDHLVAGLFLFGLLALAMVRARRMLPARANARAGLLLFAGFVAWNFLSITWSAAPASGWSNSDLLLVTLLSAWTLSLAPWRSSSATLLFVAFAVAATTVCAITLISALDAADLTARFTAARYNQPLDYPNTSAAFATVALIPLIVVGARPRLPAWASGLCQAGASLVFGCGLLAQSRGSLVGALVAFVVVLLVVPYRWRIVLRLGFLGVVFVVLNHPSSAIFDAALGTGHAGPALHHAAHLIWMTTAIGGVYGAALALAERRVGDWPPVRRRARLAGMVAVAIAALGVAGAAATHAGSIKSTVQDQWQSLRHPGGEYAGGANADTTSTNRLYNVNPRERYDYWRVAVDGFRAAPLGGMGAGGFAHRYERDRRYEPYSKYPHNLVMSVLGDDGIVGIALMLGLGSALAAGLVRRRRAMSGAERPVVAIAAGVGVYFFAHGQFDWLEAYPVLTGPVLGFLLVAIIARDAPAAATREARVPALLGRATLGVVALVALVALLLPWVALRYAARAKGELASSPAAAYVDFNRAADANPLDPSPLDLLGVAALTRGDTATARSAFHRALGREDTYLGHFGLALAAQQAGDRATAVREARRSLARDAASPNLAAGVRRIERATSPDIDTAGILRLALADPVYYATARIH